MDFCLDANVLLGVLSRPSFESVTWRILPTACVWSRGGKVCRKRRESTKKSPVCVVAYYIDAP